MENWCGQNFSLKSSFGRAEKLMSFIQYKAIVANQSFYPRNVLIKFLWRSQGILNAAAEFGGRCGGRGVVRQEKWNLCGCFGSHLFCALFWKGQGKSRSRISQIGNANSKEREPTYYSAKNSCKGASKLKNIRHCRGTCRPMPTHTSPLICY